MRYGNTAVHLKKALFVGVITGVLAYVFSAFMFVFYEKLPLASLGPLCVIVILPPLAIGLGVIPTVMFAIHLCGDCVEHRFLGRWTISRARASEFVSMTTPYGYFFAACLDFSDGTKIRIFGMHRGALAALERDLESRRLFGVASC